MKEFALAVVLFFVITLPGNGQTLSKEYISAAGRTIATIAAPTHAFLDSDFNTPQYSQFQDPANLMYIKQITHGCLGPDAVDYCPTQNLPRDAMAVFIIRSWSIRMWGDPEIFATKSPYNPTPWFTDVPASSGNFSYIQKMWELGLTQGCATGQYCPATTASNRDVAVFSVRARNAAEKRCAAPLDGSNRNCALTLDAQRYAYSSSPYFADTPPSDSFNFSWAQLALKFGAVSLQTANPTCTSGVGNFCPGTAVTRGQMTTYITRIVLADGSF